MPTWDCVARFHREFSKLTAEQQRQFRLAVGHFVEDLKVGSFRKGLRIKKVQGPDDIWEMTWATDGRATFHYGESVREGEKHVVWRRIGTHAIYDRP